MASISTDRPMTTGDVAEFFGVTPSAVVQWANANKLAYFRTPGGQRRFRREDVEAFALASVSTPEAEAG